MLPNQVRLQLVIGRGAPLHAISRLTLEVDMVADACTIQFIQKRGGNTVIRGAALLGCEKIATYVHFGSHFCRLTSQIRH